MADKNIAKKEKAIEIMKKMDIYKPHIKVDLETGEILSEEEMREFDGDIEEPKDLDDNFDTSAFDKDALCKLDEMFGDKLTLR